ncbi:MAG: NAD(P)-dependent oxidoreductase [Gammaproteobacteria bacterium]
MKAGVIGLGAMGAPMALNLHRRGFLAGVWNRTAGKSESLAMDTGVACAATPAVLADMVDVLVISVSRDPDLRAVIAACLPGLRAGTVIVDTSTVSAGTARDLCASLGAHGVDFLDCPVSGGVEGARRGTLAMMAGGNEPALARVRDALGAIAATVVHMGPSGSGQLTKAVNQIMAAGINQAVSEALAFGAEFGLDMGKVIDVVGQGAAANWFLTHRGRSMTEGRYTPGFKVSLHHKDLLICQAMAHGKTLPIVELTLAHYARLMVQGHGDEDISALYRIKREAVSG